LLKKAFAFPPVYTRLHIVTLNKPLLEAMTIHGSAEGAWQKMEDNTGERLEEIMEGECKE